MTGPWKSTDDTPDWKDSGAIELRADNGEIIRADLTFDVASDELPIIELRDGSGNVLSFFEFKEWRKVKVKRGTND